MKKFRIFLGIAIILLIISFFNFLNVYGVYFGNQERNQTVQEAAASSSVAVRPDGSEAVELAKLSQDEWKKRLTSGQYKVLKLSGTETPFTSPLLNEKRKGTYVTADCGEPVFRSEQKFETGTGWPSFYAPIIEGAVLEQDDSSLGQSRTEILSPICKSHLGHVFNDAPQTPTGLRYCVNGLALLFIPDTIQ